eukprot:g5329.t1
MTWFGLDIGSSVYCYKIILLDAILICLGILVLYILGLMKSKWFPWQYKVEGVPSTYIVSQVVIAAAGLGTSILALVGLTSDDPGEYLT